MSNAIVFIYGAWLTKLSWEKFVSYFEGCICLLHCVNVPKTCRPLCWRLPI